MNVLKELLEKTLLKKGTSLHLTVGAAPTIRKNGELVTLTGGSTLCQEDTEEFAKEVLGDDYEELLIKGEYDISYSVPGVGRFRVNICKQRGSYALHIKVVGFEVQTLSKLNMPKVIGDLTEQNRGLILVTGPAASGKSTTVAAMINEINANSNSYIVTLEEPIKYLHKHKKSLINQREVGKDTENYVTGMKAAFKEDPNVIYVDTISDPKVFQLVLHAAELGYLVISTMHTLGAVNTIERLIDMFPKDQQHQVRVQLASVLQGIVSQQLVPYEKKKGRILAQEILVNTSGVQNLIREGRIKQIESMMQTGAKYDMKTMDMALVDLHRANNISRENALSYAMDKQIMERMLNI